MGSGNANGEQDPGDVLLENIPSRLQNLGSTTTLRAGELRRSIKRADWSIGRSASTFRDRPLNFDLRNESRKRNCSSGRGEERKRAAFGLG